MQEPPRRDLSRKKFPLQNRDTAQPQQASKRSRFDEKQNNNPNSITNLTQNLLLPLPGSTVHMNTNLSRVARNTNDQVPLEECGSDTDLSYQFARCRV